jgi:hypothetical protein
LGASDCFSGGDGAEAGGGLGASDGFSDGGATEGSPGCPFGGAGGVLFTCSGSGPC